MLGWEYRLQLYFNLFFPVEFHKIIFLPSFLLVVFPFHLSMTTFVFRFELKCNVQKSKSCILTPRAYCSLFLCEQQAKLPSNGMHSSALYLCTVSRYSREWKIPWMPSKAFCVADICLCVHVRVPALSERQEGGAAVNVLWDNERRMTKSEGEKTVKAGKGMSLGVRGPEEVWILTVCGGLSIPHTDVHNHHPRQLIIMMTAVTTGRIGRQWLIGW